MKTLIGMVTFGNLEFTKLAIRGIRETTRSAYDLFLVVGKPGDVETTKWLIEEKIPHVVHSRNRGFPASVNDLYDQAWPRRPRLGSGPGYDALIIMGNDVVPYPGAVDELIGCAGTTDWEWVCSSQFDSNSLVATYPKSRRFFEGENLVFRNFRSRPWELHREGMETAARARWSVGREKVEPNCIKDVRNLCLFKRSVAEKIGYADVNFWPGGYFEDNDYCTRALRAGIKACGLLSSAYFHFWSRTIHQGSGSTTGKAFQLNREFYERKWGGPFGAERWEKAFNGRAERLCNGVDLPGSLRIRSRSDELSILEYWRNKNRNRR